MAAHHALNILRDGLPIPTPYIQFLSCKRPPKLRLGQSHTLSGMGIQHTHKGEYTVFEQKKREGFPVLGFCKLFFCLLWVVLAAGAGFAQDSANPTPVSPISTLAAGDFRALAVTADGDRLLVADVESGQVRIYDFTDPANPLLLNSVDVGGTPVALVGGEAFGLAAVVTDAASDTVEVIAPPLPGPRVEYMAGANYVDIAKNPHSLVRSPDNHWAIAVSEAAYTLLEIHAPDNIDAYAVDMTLIDAALSNTTAYILHDQTLEDAPLQSGDTLHTEQSLTLDGTPSLIALNARASDGAVVLDDNRVVFFDPQRLEKTSEFTVDGSPITSINFLSNPNGEFLVVTQQNSSTIKLLDSADPQQASTMRSLEKAIRAVVVYDNYVIATDGVTISIFES